MQDSSKRMIVHLGCVTAMLLLAACCGSNNWLKGHHKTSDGEFKFHNGIWRTCLEMKIKEDCFEKCSTIRDVTAHLAVVRIFSVSSIIALMISLIYLLCGFINNEIKGFISSLFLFISALLAGMMLIIFHHNCSLNGASYYWSFYIAIPGSVIAIASGIMGLFIK